jgi:hypothetical protein
MVPVPPTLRGITLVFMFHRHCISIIKVLIFRIIYIYIAPLKEHCHNSKNTTFLERGKNHWPGQCNHIKRTTLLPSRGHFRNWMCDAIPLVRYGLRRTSCLHNSKWAFFSCDTLLYIYNVLLLRCRHVHKHERNVNRIQ